MTTHTTIAGNAGAAPTLPSGSFVELNLAMIDEGKLLAQVNNAITDGHRELQDYREQTGDPKGKVTISMDIELEYDPDMRDHVMVSHAVKKKIPARKARTVVKEKGGHLLCQPTGSDSKSPDQFRLFTGDGKPIGTWDPKTGATIDTPDVAGKISKAAT